MAAVAGVLVAVRRVAGGFDPTGHA
jgi:hypothetical protein